jgi:integrase
MMLDEVHAVLKDLYRRSKWSNRSFGNLIVFRLSCCCGLRRTEIAGLLLGDLVLTGPRPCIRVRKENTKGRKDQRRARAVPLWWDKATLADLTQWVESRYLAGATAKSPCVPSLVRNRQYFGKPISESAMFRRWRTAIRCLGKERVKQLSIHCGRHTFASLSLAAGHSLAEVRDALGHRSIATTGVYLHCIPTGKVPDVFGINAADAEGS